jgi:DNA-binding MarR family transcriptional regulator
METGNIIALISRIHDNAHHFITKKLQEQGIGDIVPSHGGILASLYQYGPMSMKELAQRVHRKKNTLTVLVEKLINLGYIARSTVPGDRRVSMISLTDKAKQIQANFEEISRELINKVYQDVSAEEKICLVTLLQKVDKNFLF